MIRVTEHTRREGSKPLLCRACRGEIRAGDRYRSLVGMDTDIWDRGFVREVVHDFCASGEEWALRDDLRRPRKPAEVHIPDWPAGTKVILRDDFGREWRTVTRSEPWNVGGHASVLVEGISGSYICERMRFDTEDRWAALPHFAQRHAAAHALGGSK